MSGPAVPLVLDVSRPPGLRPAEERLAGGLAAALPAAQLVRSAGTRLVSASRPGPVGNPRAFESLRRWLTAPAGVAARSRRTAAWPALRLPAGIPPRIPSGAILLVPTLAAWAGPVADLVERRSDLKVVALQAGASGLSWPEHDPPALVARLAQARARCERLGVRSVAGADLSMPPLPSWLAGTRAPAPDPALAAAPAYVVAWGAIEMRSNAAMLIQLWRDLLSAGGRPPRLVLAGSRGPDAEEIRPLLDWNPALRAHVTEAPDLRPQDLRTLLAHARALLCPGLVPADAAALARDAAALGVPVLAAPDPGAPPAPTITRIGARDGLGWRAAVLAAAERPPAAWPAPAPALPDWEAFAVACLQQGPAVSPMP